VADALYTPQGDLLVPGPLTVGPWTVDAQHGGPVAALLARAVEAVPAPGPMQVVRLTVDLVRPVPLQPLAVSTAITRPGRKVQIVEASVFAGQVEVARVRALRIRVTPVGVPPQPPRPPSPPLPDDLPSFSQGTLRTAFADAFDLRFAAGSWEDLGPVTMWSRLLVPVVAGEAPTALQRVAAAADFGNGLSRILDFETHVFINPDLTVALARLPVGEWIGFDMVSRLSSDGFGQAESLIFDADGPVGRAVQSLIVEAR
jgi:hypothetical protein